MIKVAKTYSLIFTAVITSVAAVLFYSCSHKDGDTSNVFCYNESNDITSLDPAFAREFEIMWVTNQLFDGLVELDSNLNIVPCIAKSWDISPDGKMYTFHLRDGVYFHASPLFADSTRRKVVAQDFVYSFSRITDPKVASPGQWIFSNVDFQNQNGFEAQDDSTFVIHLSRAFQPFLGILTTQYCNVVPHEVVDHYGQDFREHPVGTGPFKFAFWYENVALVFHRFEHFWQFDKDGRQLPYLDAVKIDMVKDMSVEYQGLLQGRYDFMSGIHPSFKDELLDPNGNLIATYEDRLYFQKTPFIKTDYLGFVLDPSVEITKDSPLLDMRVRQALHFAINKKEMVKYLRNNTVFAAKSGFVPPKLLPHRQDQEDTYNPTKAKALLAEAGFPNGQGLPKFVCATTSDYADLLEYIQHQYEEIGVHIEVQVMQSGTLKEATAKNQLAIFRKSWLADYADAENFLSLFYTKNFSPAGPNYTHFTNAEFDQLYVQAGSENDPLKREKLCIQMDSIVGQWTPVIPLYYDQVSHFIRNEISGFQTNPVNMLDLKAVRKNGL